MEGFIYFTWNGRDYCYDSKYTRLLSVEEVGDLMGKRVLANKHHVRKGQPFEGVLVGAIAESWPNRNVRVIYLVMNQKGIIVKGAKIRVIE